jgi:hypothetical protein
VGIKKQQENKKQKPIARKAARTQFKLQSREATQFKIHE